MLKKNLANIITSIRIIGAIVLLFVEAFSKPYFIIYSIAGFSDAIDGFVARKLNITSKFGSKLDSISDLLFYIVLFIKIMPYLLKVLPKIIWIFISFILLIRIISYLIGFFKNHEFASNHIFLNKVTGALIFALPYFYQASFYTIYCFIIVGVAFIAAIQDCTIEIKKLPKGN